MTAVDYCLERFWDDVEPGHELADIRLTLDWTAMVLQVSGSQDWNPIHHDFDFASDSGMPTIFYNTGWTTGLLGRLLTDWAGPRGWVEAISFQMRGMNAQGTEARAYGIVSGKRLDGDRALVDLDIFIENSQAGITTPGKATVRLPRNPREISS